MPQIILLYAFVPPFRVRIQVFTCFCLCDSIWNRLKTIPMNGGLNHVCYCCCCYCCFSMLLHLFPQQLNVMSQLRQHYLQLENYYAQWEHLGYYGWVSESCWCRLHRLRSLSFRSIHFSLILSWKKKKKIKCNYKISTICAHKLYGQIRNVCGVSGAHFYLVCKLMKLCLFRLFPFGNLFFFYLFNSSGLRRTIQLPN